MLKNKESSKFGQIGENLIGYVETKIQLIKLDAKEKLAQVLTKVIVGFIIFLLIILALTFASLAAAIKINAILLSSYLGHLIVAGVYLIVVLSFGLFINKEEFFKGLAKGIDKSLNKNETQE